MTEPTMPLDAPATPLSWVLGPAYVLTLGVAGATVAALSGPLGGEWTLNTSRVFLLAGAVTLIGMLPTLLFGRQRADPALVFGSTLVGVALFGRLALDQGSLMSLLLPALGATFGLAPVLMSDGDQKRLFIAWVVAAAALWMTAQGLLAFGA